MKKLISMGVIGTVMLTSCALTESTVLPRGDNRFDVVTTGHYKQETIKSALEKANETCDKFFKKPAIETQKTKNRRKWSDVMNDMVDNYTTTMTFVCQ